MFYKRKRFSGNLRVSLSDFDPRSGIMVKRFFEGQGAFDLSGFVFIQHT